MSHLIKAGLFGCLLGIFGVVLAFLPVAHDWEEDAGLGILFNWRGATQRPEQVAVVSIDEESSESLNLSGNPANWPRSLYARLIERLGRSGARVIVFDIYFIEPRSPAEDDLLASAMKEAGNVILAEPLRAKDVASAESGSTPGSDHRIVRFIKPIDPFVESAFATAPFVLPRVPVKVSQYWTFQPSAGDAPTFPVVALQLYALPLYEEFRRLLESAAPSRSDALPPNIAAILDHPARQRFVREIRAIFRADPSIQERLFADVAKSSLAGKDPHAYEMLTALIKMYAGENHRYLNYYGPPRTIATVPFHRLLSQDADTANGAGFDFRGKAVFVGLAVSDRHDSYYTTFSGSEGVYLSGVEVAATAFANLLEDTAVKPVATGSLILLLFGWGILVGMVCRLTGPVVGALAVVSLTALYLVAANHRFGADGTWMPIVVPLFVQAPFGFAAAVFWNYFETYRERQNIRNALSYYVPSDVVHELARNVVDIRRAGQTVYGVCLFADAAGYTTLSESMGPRELSEFMHRYFEAIFAPVKQNGGVVIDLKGDSILAIWKGSGPSEQLRRQACNAALDLARAVNQFNRLSPALRLPTRIGVHAGPVFLGNIGAGEHYMYGPTGDTVNTASRMDGLNKHLNTQILVSREVIEGLDGFLNRELGAFRLKGKSQPVLVYELLCRIEECEESQKRISALFAAGLAALRRCSWDEAVDKFSEIVRYSDDGGPAHFYIKLCEQYKKNAPVEAWDGVVPLADK